MQVEPQSPQLLVVVKAVSQPVPTLESQLPQPALQLIEQVPLLQLGVPLVELHTVPQPPQLLTLA